MAKLIYTDPILNNEEIVTKVKQLGMMHLLYWMRKNVYKALISFDNIPKYIQECNSIEGFILTFMNTEKKLIEQLDETEKAYKTRKH